MADQAAVLCLVRGGRGRPRRLPRSPGTHRVPCKRSGGVNRHRDADGLASFGPDGNARRWHVDHDSVDRTTFRLVLRFEHVEAVEVRPFGPGRLRAVESVEDHGILPFRDRHEGHAGHSTKTRACGGGGHDDHPQSFAAIHGRRDSKVLRHFDAQPVVRNYGRLLTVFRARVLRPSHGHRWRVRFRRPLATAGKADECDGCKGRNGSTTPADACRPGDAHSHLAKAFENSFPPGTSGLVVTFTWSKALTSMNLSVDV